MKRSVRRLRSGNHDAFMNRCARIGPRDGIAVWGCTRLTLDGNDVVCKDPAKAIQAHNCKDVRGLHE